MCLIVFDWRPGDAVPLRLAANRDEFHARPSAALHLWEETPDILGGRDLRAGGTWLAAHRRGRLAAVTNVRAPGFAAPANGSSRGELVHDALESEYLSDWLQHLERHAARHYAAFNLLASDGLALWHLHHGPTGTRLQEVAPGLHGLSNASLDTPWPKLLRSRQRLASAIAETPRDDAASFGARAWELLADDLRAADEQLPETGVGMELERFLSAPFIVGEEYGTRASTWVSWEAESGIAIGERAFGPGGRLLEERQCRIDVPPLPVDRHPHAR